MKYVAAAHIIFGLLYMLVAPIPAYGLVPICIGVGIILIKGERCR